METLTAQLTRKAASANERAQRNIANLIDRLNHFEQCGDEAKLKECVAEAQLWLAA